VVVRGELAFIQRLIERLPQPPPGQTWAGDDAAVLVEGRLLATDLLAEGIHFDLDWCEPADVGWKALAVNLSDLAAMGGTPEAAVVAVTVPDEGVADDLLDGLLECAERHRCPLVGGDTSSGDELVVAVSVSGTTKPPAPVLRSGALPGDTVFVTGPLGAAAAVLARLQAGEAVPPDEARPLLRPEPRLEEGRAAADEEASAMIDVSDGLALDLHRLCQASGVGARLEASAVPVAPGATLEQALGGGEDYELCFTGATGGIRIGEIVSSPEVLLDGEPLPPTGWEHAL
jgi:thiamine-monophosphate kinase